MSDPLLIARIDDAINRAALEEVRALLDLGVSPNAKDVVGDPILIGAAWVGAPDVVRLLLLRGADPTAAGLDGLNALQRIATIKEQQHEGHLACAEVLRAARAVK